MTNNSLQNIENYKTEFSNTSVEIYAKYLGLIQEYMLQCVESIYIRKIPYYKYVICKGLDTINHVFKILLLYTKNLDITYYHCQKSFYYYVEFMGQIGDDNHSFLQLNSKDAALFVYKKTIFDINNEYRKEYQPIIETLTVTNSIDILITIYNYCLQYLINDHDFSPDNKHSILKKIDMTLSKCSQHLLNLALCGDENEYMVRLQIINELFKKVCVENVNIIPYIEILTRKLKNLSINIDEFRLQLLHEEHKHKITNLTPLRYINWLLQL